MGSINESVGKTEVQRSRGKKLNKIPNIPTGLSQVAGHGSSSGGQMLVALIKISYRFSYLIFIPTTAGMFSIPC